MFYRFKAFCFKQKLISDTVGGVFPKTFSLFDIKCNQSVLISIYKHILLKS